jgi:hypothetical protein
MSGKSETGIGRRALLDALDALLWKDALADDFRSFPRIALGMAEMLSNELDDGQREALIGARTLWEGTLDETRRLYLLSAMGSRCDLDSRENRAATPFGYRNRLLFCALNTVTGLTGFAGEFIVEVGIGAGLDLRSIEKAVRQTLPQLGPVASES